MRTIWKLLETIFCVPAFLIGIAISVVVSVVAEFALLFEEVNEIWAEQEEQEREQ